MPTLKVNAFLIVLVTLLTIPSLLWATSLNTELVLNGGAEAGSTANWTINGVAAVTATSNNGSFSFSGPGRTLATAFQEIDISDLATSIDQGNITSNFSVFLQRRSSDPAEVDLLFLNASGGTISSAFFAGNVNNVFVQSTDVRIVPVATRSIRIQFETRAQPNGGSADGFMDDASLVLSGNAPAVPEPSSFAFFALAFGFLWRSRKNASS